MTLDEQTDMKKLIVAFCNFMNTFKKIPLQDMHYGNVMYCYYSAWKYVYCRKWHVH